MNKTLKENITIEERISIEDKLLPEDLRFSLTELRGGLQEWNGLSILAESLIRSDTCSVDKGRGEIIADFDSQVVVVLRFGDMLRKRLDWLSQEGNLESWLQRNPCVPEPHLDVWARHKEDPRWQLTACIVASGSRGLPITDVATSFVMWADSGFPRSPHQLTRSIMEVKGPDSLAEFMEAMERKEKISEDRREDARIARRIASEESERREILRRKMEDAKSVFRTLGWRQMMSEHRKITHQGQSKTLDPVSEGVINLLDGFLDPPDDKIGGCF